MKKLSSIYLAFVFLILYLPIFYLIGYALNAGDDMNQFTGFSLTHFENLFGESIQLHQKYTLCDVIRDRPVFVSYNWVVNYIVEGFIVLLFLGGIWAGKRSKLMWMCLSFFALDMILHIGLGFGINEVYIMTAHWAYVIPLCIGCLIKSMKGGIRHAITLLTALIAFYLIVYNSALIIFTL